MRTFFGAILLLLAIGCTGGETSSVPEQPTAAPQPDSSSTWVVTEHGIGPVRAGMSIAQASAVLGKEIRPTYEVFEDCDHVALPNGPAGVWLMVFDDTIARVDVDTTLVVTAEGVGVGDAEERVLSIYTGRVEVEPHAYTEGHYLVVSAAAPADSLSRIIFETYQGRVTNFRAGLLPAVAWVEGCA